MTRRLLRIAAVAFALSARAGTGPAAGPDAGPGGADKAGPDKGGPDRRGGPPVIGCPSLANYRMLLHDGAAGGCGPAGRSEGGPSRLLRPDAQRR